MVYLVFLTTVILLEVTLLVGDGGVWAGIAHQQRKSYLLSSKLIRAEQSSLSTAVIDNNSFEQAARFSWIVVALDDDL